MSIGAAGRIGPQPRIASRTARGRGCAVERGAGRPHHARSVSISRSTCMASARSNSSAASSSASARIAAAALRRAASMRAARTAVEIGVPSLVNTSSAREASASGRKVMVSATKSRVLQIVRQCPFAASVLPIYGMRTRSRVVDVRRRFTPPYRQNDTSPHRGAALLLRPDLDKVAATMPACNWPRVMSLLATRSLRPWAPADQDRLDHRRTHPANASAGLSSAVFTRRRRRQLRGGQHGVESWCRSDRIEHIHGGTRSALNNAAWRSACWY